MISQQRRAQMLDAHTYNTSRKILAHAHKFSIRIQACNLISPIKISTKYNPQIFHYFYSKYHKKSTQNSAIAYKNSNNIFMSVFVEMLNI